MGIFDRVYIRCRCGESIELQSYSGGKAWMGNYSIKTSPPNVLVGLDGETGTCPKCGLRYLVQVKASAIVHFGEREDQNV